jgi:hypothetical protein
VARSGTITLNGAAKQTLSGTMTATSSFYNLTITNTSGASATDNERTSFVPGVDFNAAAAVAGTSTITTANVRVEYETGQTYTFNNINWSGQASTSRIFFRNSAITGTWLLKATGTQSVSYVNVSRSDASVAGGSQINTLGCPSNSFNAGSNTNWLFPSGSNVVNVYYSVGQATTSLMTGTPTLTITGGAGVFSAAQTGNIGVGDRVTYNTNQIAYIAAKTNADMMHWTLVTATGTSATNVTNATVNSITREYTSLAAAIAGASDANHLNTVDLTPVGCGNSYILNLPAYYDSGADTAAVTVSGYTTGANNYIKIYTPASTTIEANQNQRHNGTVTGNGYYLDQSAYLVNTLSNSLDYTIIDGLKLRAGDASYRSTIFSTGSNVVIKNNLVVYSNSRSINLNNSGSATVYNNFIISAGDSLYAYGSGTYLIYNNTLLNSSIAYGAGGGSATAKNNFASSYGGTFSGGFTNNGSINTTGNVGLQSLVAANQFANVLSGNEDLHLKTGSALISAGADLSGSFSTDIDGQSRSAAVNAWDIGADESARAVYYSVGQNTSDHKTGSPTVTVSSSTGLATFSVAQTASNMGVGDAITYGSNICYISAKASTTAWYCTTATGTMPVATTTAPVTSITHAFSSLSVAIDGYWSNGAYDSVHLNTKDLYSGNYQLNIPCYYDSGDDTTSVWVRNWNTAVANYIKIYTPTSTSFEGNSSQRHSGKIGSGYKLKTATYGFVLYANNYWIDGLQIEAGGSELIYTSAAPKELKVSNSIVSYGSQTGVYSNAVGGNYEIWNNIFYGNGSRATSLENVGMLYAYNNTFIHTGPYPSATTAIYGGGSSAVVKNNIAKGYGGQS